MNIKEYILEKLRNSDLDVSLSESSGFVNLLVNPLSIIMADTLNLANTLDSRLSLSNPELLSEDEMDLLADNFMVSRNPGEYASGNITLYFTLPTDFSLPLNSTFKTKNGKLYTTTASYSISSSSMLNNSEKYPYFSTGLIPVKAANPGKEFNVPKNSITQSVSTLTPSPAFITNNLPIVGGGEKESNTALKTKIINSINNKSLASPESIKRVLVETYPTITNLEIVGPGDTEMSRDIVYSGMTLNSYYTTDFKNTISGLHNYPFNANIAYLGIFQDIDESTTISLPDPEDFTYEFTNSMYGGIATNEDADYAEISVYKVLDEGFNNSSYDSYWIASDSISGNLGETILSGEIKPINDELRLGKTIDISIDSYMVDGSTIEELKERLRLLMGVSTRNRGGEYDR